MGTPCSSRWERPFIRSTGNPPVLRWAARCLPYSRYVSQTTATSKTVSPSSPMGKSESHPVDLVDDEHDQKSDHPWVGPDLVPEQRRHQHDLDYAMQQQVRGAELQGRSRHAPGGMQQMRGQEVVWIL